MFYVVYENGEGATEAELGDWNHVPRDRRLKEIGLLIPAFGWDMPPLPLKLAGEERYHCSRLDVAPLGGIGRRLGYVLIGIQDGTCRRIVCDYRGIRFDNPDPDGLNIREETWREGVKNG